MIVNFSKCEVPYVFRPIGTVCYVWSELAQYLSFFFLDQANELHVAAIQGDSALFLIREFKVWNKENSKRISESGNWQLLGEMEFKFLEANFPENIPSCEKESLYNILESSLKIVGITYTNI